MAHSLEPTFILPEHYHAFGRIVQAFAAVEYLYKIIAGRINTASDGATLFLMCNTGYEGAKNILTAIINGLDISEDKKKSGLDLIDAVHKRATLRNNASHNTWTEGRRPKSIKPIVLRARNKLVTLGTGHNEKDWTAVELNQEADLILEGADAVTSFFVSLGIDLGEENKGDKGGSGRA
ncbi:MAG TPA: hypothetical protein VNW15_07935 [Rhizomicrobium sp.]|jgi:hypothetical protein|nr:hypothetical protein [Rhizomicrobium sp.]